MTTAIMTTLLRPQAERSRRRIEVAASDQPGSRFETVSSGFFLS